MQPPAPPRHYVATMCAGTICNVEGCLEAATHKISEAIMYDEPFQARHPYTAFVCCSCFRKIMGPKVLCETEESE